MVLKTASNTFNRVAQTVDLKQRESRDSRESTRSPKCGAAAMTDSSGMATNQPHDPSDSLPLQDSVDGSDSNFPRILQRAKSGDLSAVGELCELSRKYLLLIANQDLKPNMLQKFGASDVVQQSMVIANKKIEHFGGDSKREFMAWMRQILINECRQTSRMYQGTEKRAVHREQPIQQNNDSVQLGFQLDDPHRTPSTQAAADEQIRLVHLAIAEMEPLQQRVIEMRNWQELSFEEIGKAIGKSAEASRKVWSRAIIRLQQELDKLGAI